MFRARTILITGLTLAIGALIGMAATNIYHDRSSVSPTRSQDVDELLRYALREGKTSAQRGPFLDEIVIRTVRSNPNSARTAWQAIKDSSFFAAAGERTGPIQQGTSYLSRLVAFQDAIDQAILSTTSTRGFEEVWAVREEVEREILYARGQLGKVVLERITEDRKRIETETQLTDQCSLAIIECFDAINPSLVVLVGTSPSKGGDATLKEILALETSISKLVREKASNFETQLNAYEKDLTSTASGPVEPAVNNTEKGSDRFGAGRGEKLLEDVGRLVELMEKSDLAGWQEARSLITPASTKVETPLGTFLDSLSQKIYKTESLGYNLWALREIHAAEDSDNWAQRLAAIDTGFLEPPVSGLYDSVRARRVEEVKDPHRRGETVRILLNSPRTPLSAF